MERYKVEITDQALSDLEDIYRYIAEKLSAPDTALQLYDRLMEAVLSLERFPARAALVSFEPERSAGLRRLNVGRYAIFFLAGEKCVRVTNILYGSSDVETRLK